ncbi:DUF6065 family protein [Oricola sp.]|uniref:DUF6065 family protein n=1 Tax=Oricola sp. TaxID=1979950 RepID=UPI003BABB16C
MAKITNLHCYKVLENACRIVPARASRQWMDDTNQRFAYRCLPLSIANAMGWELLLSEKTVATWNGKNGLNDIAVEFPDGDPGGKPAASSHFGEGVLTFHVGYLFRTDPGIGIWARGAPNLPKDGIAPLEGIIETDWLDFTFTMNWKFTRPGTVTFEKDEPFCFITPVDYRALMNVEPQIVPISEKPELEAAFGRWQGARLDFNEKLRTLDPEAVKQGWQKWYMRGVNGPDGGEAPGHVSKLRLAEPIEPGRNDGNVSSRQDNKKD